MTMAEIAPAPSAIQGASIQGASIGARLLAWLHERPRPLQWLVLVVAAVVFQLVWSAVGIAVVVQTGSAPEKAHPVMRWLILEASLWKALSFLALGVMIEEVAFRLLPLGFALGVYRDNPRTGWLVAATVLLSSIAFGYFHGIEWYRLTLQAVGGVVMALVFLKACGMDGRYWARALGTAWLAHLMFNTAVLAMMRIAMAVT